MLLLDDLMQLHRLLTLTQFFQQRLAFRFYLFQLLLRLFFRRVENPLFFFAQLLQLALQVLPLLLRLRDQRFLFFLQLLIFQNLGFQLLDQLVLLGTLLAL